jgi:hypothetical protein
VQGIGWQRRTKSLLKALLVTQGEFEMSNESKRSIHQRLNDAYFAGAITHEQKVVKLKAAGITGAENIDFDNDYMEIRDANISLDSLDPDFNDDVEIYSAGSKDE